MSDFLYNDSELQMDTNLILCIEEHDNIRDSNSVDTTLFIGYSRQDNDYYVRGKRQDIGSQEFVPYAFRCKSANNLYDFIEFVIDAHSSTSITLYNFNNLENDDTDMLTYEFFESNMDRNYEMVAYDKVELSRDIVTSCLRMLKNMYNWNNSV
jgi:hypothetical protein